MEDVRVDKIRANIQYVQSYSMDFLTEKNIQQEIEKINMKNYLTFKYDNNVDKLKEILNLFVKQNVDLKNKTLLLTFKKGYLSKNDCQKLLEIDEKLKSLGLSLKIVDGGFWDLQTIIKTNEKLDAVVDKVKSARVAEENNRPLTDFEKFVWIYSFVANRKYTANKNDFDSPRYITPILNVGDVVCVGFATLLKELCDRVGIECYVNRCSVIEKNDQEKKDYGHANNIVVINNKVYYCDACWDCITEKRQTKTLNYCLLPASDIKSHQTLEVINSSAPYFDIEKDKQEIQKLLESVSKKSELSSNEVRDIKFMPSVHKYIELIPHYQEKPKKVDLKNLFNQDCKEEAIYYLESITNLLNTKQQGDTISIDKYRKALINIHLANGRSKSQAEELTDDIICRTSTCAKECFNEQAKNSFRKEIENTLIV